MRCRPVALLLASGLLAAPPRPARAQDPGPADEAVRDFAGPTDITAPPAPEATAEELYAAGERAYFIGDFATAVTRFEAAYAKSRLPPLLYNIGLAYMRRHELTKDAGDLRRARSILLNFRVELERDPTIGSARHVEDLLAQIAATLEKLEAPPPGVPAVTAAPPVAAPASCPEPAPAPAPTAPPLPRAAGASLLAIGGVALAAGAATGLGFALKGRQFGGQLADLQAMQQADGCADASSARCDALADAVAITKDNGHRANLLAGSLGGGLTALGVAGLVAGAVLLARGAPSSRRARLQLGPTIGGVWLRGTF